MAKNRAFSARRGLLRLMLVAAVTIPVGCGVVYQSPKVSRDVTAGLDVREIALTPESVLLANRSPYSPRNLPQEFYAAASATQGAGLGALPEAPDTPETRPTRLELRPPANFTPPPYRIGVGDVVLLAPGGASFDAYPDFAARGTHFRALVEALP